MKKLAIIVAIIAMPYQALAQDMHGGINDIFKYSRSERPDLYSHAALGATGAIVGGQVLDQAGVKYADEIAAVGTCVALTAYKEGMKDQWFDRGDAGANCYGAAGGYVFRKVMKKLFDWDGVLRWEW